MIEPIKTKLKFDGEGLKDNFIDVKDLAPSLIALSDLIQESNKLINGDKTTINVKVNADIKQGCFEVLLMFDFSVVENLKDLVTPETTRSIKEILEWLEIISSLIGEEPVGAGGGLLGLLSLIKIFKGKPIDKNQIIGKYGNNYTINTGGGDLIINEQTFIIHNAPSIRKLTQDFLSPLHNKGIDSIELYDDDKTHNILNHKDYKPFLDYDDWSEEKAHNTTTNITTRHLVVYKPEFNEDAKRWSFLLDEKSINVDISKTTIAKDVFVRGGVRVGDTYKVKLEEEEHKTDTGQYRTIYKILKVLEFIKGDRQDDFI